MFANTIALLNKVRKDLTSLETLTENELAGLISLAGHEPSTIHRILFKAVQSESRRQQKKIAKEYFDKLIGLVDPGQDSINKVTQKNKSTDTLVAAMSTATFGTDFGWYLFEKAGALTLAVKSGSGAIAAALTGTLAISGILFFIVYKVAKREIAKAEKNAINQLKLHALKLRLLELRTTSINKKIELAASRKSDLLKSIAPLYNNLQKRLEYNLNSRCTEKEFNDKLAAHALFAELHVLMEAAYRNNPDKVKQKKAKKELEDLEKKLDKLIVTDNAKKPEAIENINATEKEHLVINQERIRNFGKSLKNFIFCNKYITPVVVGTAMFGGLYFGLFSFITAVLGTIKIAAIVSVLTALTCPVGFAFVIALCAGIALICAYQNYKSIQSLESRQHELGVMSQKIYKQESEVDSLEQELKNLEQENDKLGCLNRYLKDESETQANLEEWLSRFEKKSDYPNLVTTNAKFPKPGLLTDRNVLSYTNAGIFKSKAYKFSTGTEPDKDKIVNVDLETPIMDQATAKTTTL